MWKQLWLCSDHEKNRLWPWHKKNGVMDVLYGHLYHAALQWKDTDKAVCVYMWRRHVKNVMLWVFLKFFKWKIKLSFFCWSEKWSNLWPKYLWYDECWSLSFVIGCTPNPYLESYLVEWRTPNPLWACPNPFFYFDGIKKLNLHQHKEQTRCPNSLNYSGGVLGATCNKPIRMAWHLTFKRHELRRIVIIVFTWQTRLAIGQASGPA